MTIPIIAKTTERQEFATRLRKSQSVLNQAVYRISIDSGHPVGDFSFMENDDFFNQFAQQVTHIKVCNAANQGCFTPDYMTALNGSNWAKYDRANSLVAADGITYGWNDGALCTGKGLSSVNGQNPPNRFGRDVFFFTVVNGKGVVPAGHHSTADCTTGGNGVTCAAHALRTGRVMY